MTTFREISHLVLEYADAPLSAEAVAAKLDMSRKTVEGALVDLQQWGVVVGVRSADGTVCWEPRSGIATRADVEALPAWADRVLQLKPRVRR